MAVKPKPDGYHSITPFFMIEGVPKLIDFLKAAFDAEETERVTVEDGTVRHAEVRIGDSMVMMGEACGPKGPTPGMAYLYVDDVEATYAKALAAGAEGLGAPEDQFYGDRSGGLVDPCGNTWWIATHIEDVTPDEIDRRLAAMANQET